MKGYEIFAESLKKLGIEEVFGNPGTTEIPMLRSVNDYVLTLHDSISVGMADGKAQVTGSPTLCNLHTVPGIGNSIAFLHTAFYNRSPVIVTAGQQDYRHIFYEPILSGDLTSLVSGLVKYKYEVKQADDIYRSLKRAYQIAEAPPKGPVFLSFPMNVMDEEYNEKFDDFHKIDYEWIDKKALREIADMINGAKYPAIVFGYEIDLYDAFEEAKDFAHALGCPVYCEPLASRGCYPSDDPQYAGDLPPASALLNMKLMQHDLVLVVGGDITLYPYTPPPPLQGKTVIFVGTDNSGKIGTHYQMNPKMFLREIMGLVQRKCNFSRSPNYTVKTSITLARKKMGTAYVMSKIAKEFRDYVIVDESISASQTFRSFLVYEHNSYFTAKTGQLGWALPAGAGMSLKKGKVLAVVGDGSFMYTPQTLWTIERYNLPLKIIILNNGGYMILRSFSKSYYNEVADKDFLKPNIDAENLVKAFHIPVKVADPNLKDLQWLREGDEARVLIINMDREIPKVFL
ncbi:benzoylformate decarboxylase [Thermoplasma volcanium GSS1]|uniref:Benzoylformate decarboxylase n=1 Tax=Thermoplasma volcanium (strain ATCC 51530 / DSM 4299 / JCM 9571 / NBRC 15438 / GSS1) TaxID=273116 RepID=Q979E0_THEVO|nr:thiamine pyrophosphate-binding protein [Thermoplasma volcanium]BAB60363.1 benzoylformate decarboxylase [Thermoplasma volcanium GSS1]